MYRHFIYTFNKSFLSQILLKGIMYFSKSWATQHFNIGQMLVNKREPTTWLGQHPFKLVMITMLNKYTFINTCTALSLWQVTNAACSCQLLCWALRCSFICPHTLGSHTWNSLIIIKIQTISSASPSISVTKEVKVADDTSFQIVFLKTTLEKESST